MQTTPEYREQEIHNLKKTTYGVVNATLSLALFHYVAWVLYKLFTFLF
jgi:hypothetical protein